MRSSSLQTSSQKTTRYYSTNLNSVGACYLYWRSERTYMDFRSVGGVEDVEEAVVEGVDIGVEDEEGEEDGVVTEVGVVVTVEEDVVVAATAADMASTRTKDYHY